MMSRIGTMVVQEEEGGAWPNDYKKKNNMGGARNSPESSSRSSSWRAPKRQRCYGNFTEFETKDWKEAWDTSLESPTELKDGPHKWNTSMSAYLYTATCKAVKDKLVKPNYDAAILSLVQNKLEKVLYNPEQPWNEYRFLLLHKTSKYVTLACQFCRQMSTLEYAPLEPRDGRKLHIFFDNHLGGGIVDHGKVGTVAEVSRTSWNSCFAPALGPVRRPSSICLW